jgi:hypothetical protein
MSIDNGTSWRETWTTPTGNAAMVAADLSGAPQAVMASAGNSNEMSWTTERFRRVAMISPCYSSANGGTINDRDYCPQSPALAVGAGPDPNPPAVPPETNWSARIDL